MTTSTAPAAQTALYSDGANPFNDANLSTQFVWKAKIRQMKARGEDVRQYLRDRNSATRSAELRAELERAKRRRQEKEAEHALWLQERARLEREAARAEGGDDALQEQHFLVLQTARRAQIRVAEGRARPLDRLFVALARGDAPDAPAVGEEDDPVRLVAQCRDARTLAAMRADAAAFVALAHAGHLDDPAAAPRVAAFFEAFVVLVDDALSRLQSVSTATTTSGIVTGDGDADGGRVSTAEATALLGEQEQEQGVSRQVMTDVVGLFESKTRAELDALRARVQAKVHGHNVADVEYWQHLLARLDVFRARALLREVHREVVARQLDRLDATAPAPQPSQPRTRGDASQRAPRSIGSTSDARGDEGDEEEYDDGFGGDDGDDDDDGMGNRGEAFNDPVPLPPAPVGSGGTGWGAQDKYRPRKPRFFNRVFAGYDWSRYNRTHYDHDNPPPKTVKGYKFNIFYPDLLDKSVAPTFYLEADPEGDSNFCLLRFHAGPPYEDVAFRIPNRPWERIPKFGYRCFFDRGILHLWFHFRRLRYRK